MAALERQMVGDNLSFLHATDVQVPGAKATGATGQRRSETFYLLEHGRLDDPGAWFSATGFTFYGGFIAAALGIACYLRRERLSLSYLDAIAAGLPLGIAVGRIGDVINGEHYGPATDFFLGVRNTHPDALTPSPDVAYHSGGLYEVLIAAICSRSRGPCASASSGRWP